MKDQFNRNIEYLRLSVTERCNLKCLYCRSETEYCESQHELSLKDIEKIIDASAKLGITKVRVTGGEPLMRKDIAKVVSAISACKDIKDISMTTNGQGLYEKAEGLKKAGLHRLNISIDSLDPKIYKEITRGGDIKKVLDGIDAAIEHKLLPIKINVVLVKGRNDNEIDNFIELCRNRPIDVRFIELMPIGEFGSDASLRINNSDIIDARPYLIPEEPEYIGQPSTDYRIDGYMGKVGFISPFSHKFCHLCNRIRITSDGKLKLCLGHNHEISLKDALKSSDPAVLYETMKNAIAKKPLGHTFDKGFNAVRTMNKTGG